jgi:DnaJ family protein A protein 2
MEAGDINFVIQEKDHDLFKRKGADLLVTKELSLNQAICGFAWKVIHLDGRQVVIKTRPGEIIHSEVIEPDTGRVLPYIRKVKDEGMPSHGNPFVKGDLYVAFQIVFPDDLPVETIEALKALLPGGDMPEDYDPEEAEEVFMDDADLRHFGKGGAVSRDNEYDEDEEGGAGQGVQCQQS